MGSGKEPAIARRGFRWVWNLRLRLPAPTPPQWFDWRTLTSAKNHVKVMPTHSSVNIDIESEIGRMKALRISAISYLNTAPLMWDFEHGNAGKELRDFLYCPIPMRGRPWLRARRISASSRRPLTPRFQGLSSFPAWRSLHAGRCGRFSWSARFLWSISSRWPWTLHR